METGHPDRVAAQISVVPPRLPPNDPLGCLRATGGPNRRPGPNQPGTPAPGGRGTDAPRPPPVRTRFNGTTPPDVPFLRPGAAGGAGDRGLPECPIQTGGRCLGAPTRARPPMRSRLHQVYSKRAQPSYPQASEKCKFSDIAKQGSSSASSALPLFIDRAGQEHPRAGSRHRFAPSRRGRGATAAEFRSRPRGREPLASSGRMGPLLHLVVLISQIRR